MCYIAGNQWLTILLKRIILQNIMDDKVIIPPPYKK